MIPGWLHALSTISLLGAILISLGIIIDETRHPQEMWIMNLVWPLTALFGSFLALWFYVAYGRNSGEEAELPGRAHQARCSDDRETPFAVNVAKATTHCGSGCTLGDIIAEWLAYSVPAAAVWFGWKSLFAEKMFAVWVLDYIFAFIFGIAFQFFTITPMRNLSVGQGIVQALKADALSLTAWQFGMYGFMAFVQFYLFRDLFGARLEVGTATFWFMMQIAMIVGFMTSSPVNWWLIVAGIKEKM